MAPDIGLTAFEAVSDSVSVFLMVKLPKLRMLAFDR